MEADISDIKNRATGLAKDVVHNGRKELADLEQMGERAIKTASSKAYKAGAYLESEAEDGLDAVVRFARAKPVESLAIAAALGYLLKRLFR